MINVLCNTNDPLDAKVEFGQTEYFAVLGDLDKKTVRSNLLASVKDEKHSENIGKILIELQSTKDTDMGFRKFVYSLNVAKKDENSKVYKFPKAITLCATLDRPQKRE